MQRSFRSRLDPIWSNITWRRVAAVVLILFAAAAIRAAYLLIFKGYVWPEWTGFGEFTDPSGKYYPAKLLWDWLELLIVPAVLAIGALLFNRAARASEQKSASDQQRETALQNYLDKMAELLLKEKLLEKKDNPEDPVVDVAQVRTVTTLRILDTGRKNVLFQFLRDAKLVDFILVKASLVEADLSHTRMDKINLSGAFLRRANLFGADLSWSHLSEADLSGANLGEADLSGTNLGEADLSGAELFGAVLRWAKYDSQTIWPYGFDYINSGAIGPMANLLGALLYGVNLFRSDLVHANLSRSGLSRSDLSEANLSGANLGEADLTRANLRRANLSGANLSEADLWKAELGGADLTGANLRGADLNGANYDIQTKWPKGFDYESSGAIPADE